ncbi:MAG: efflux RND transporter periplasmic adaptor subunit [Verrucomicrobiota bacterium]
MQWRQAVGLAAVLSAAAFNLTGCKPDPANASTTKGKDAAKDAPRRVKTTRVQESNLERLVTVSGSLAAYERATLSVKVPGRVQEVRVDLGTPVRKGELLLQLEATEYKVKLRQAEALLAQARARLGLSHAGDDDNVDVNDTSLVKEAKAVLNEALKARDRSVKLSKEGVVSESEMESVEAAYQVAVNRHQDAIEESRTRIAVLAQRRAEVEIAQQQLAETAVYAPFDGVVQERKAQVGEYLTTGSPVAELVRTDLLRLRLEVPEREAFRVQNKQRVRLTVEGDTNVYQGTIARLSPMITEPARVLIVEADVKNPGSLRPGLFARAEIVVNEREKALTVPSKSLVVFAGVEKVVVVKDGKARETEVVTGRRVKDSVEIISGLKVGETVVIEPGSLRTGQPVNTKDS